jgi:peptidoglycan/xylan/chitin deacetylase (PgdA/CDA1 family)
MPVPILAFHKVDPAFEWGVTRTTPGQFRKILSHLKREGYETVTLGQLAGRRSLPPKPVALTFDDAYESFHRYAFPVLKEFGYTATLFVITGYAGKLNDWDVNLGWLKFRHLSWEQIRELSRLGFEIGSHTVHHADLTVLDKERLARELRRSKTEIEYHIHKTVRFISFPFGRYDRRVIHACQKAGYTAGFGFVSGKRRKDSFVFERKACYLIDGIWTLKAKLSDHWAASLETSKLRFINFCSHGTSLVKPPRWKA